MPIPKPKKGEDKIKFLDRCMADKKLLSEYAENPQRYAICIAASKEKK